VDPDVMRLEVDVSGIGPNAHFKAQMVAKIRGQGWQLIPLPAGGVQAFCPANADEDIEEFYLVLSNSDRPLANVVSGAYTVRDLEQPCNCQDLSAAATFTGTFSFNYAFLATNAEWIYDLDQMANGSGTLPLTSSSPDSRQFSGAPTGSGTVDDSETDLDVSPPDVDTYQGSGALLQTFMNLPQSRLTLSVDLPNCRYNVIAAASVMGTSGSPALVGTAHSGWHAVPASGALAGSLNIPGHSIVWTGGQTGPAPYYLPGGFGEPMFFNLVGTANQAGQAQFAWSLTPGP
jgi:hypothetical protein